MTRRIWSDRFVWTVLQALRMYGAIVLSDSCSLLLHDEARFWCGESRAARVLAGTASAQRSGKGSAASIVVDEVSAGNLTVVISRARLSANEGARHPVILETLPFGTYKCRSDVGFLQRWSRFKAYCNSTRKKQSATEEATPSKRCNESHGQKKEDREQTKQLRRKQMTEYRRQHYIPKFYLKNFSEDKRGLFRYSLENRNSERSNISKACAARDFYAKADAAAEFEKTMSALEAEHAKIVRKIVAERSLAVISAEQFLLLCTLCF